METLKIGLLCGVALAALFFLYSFTRNYLIKKGDTTIHLKKTKSTWISLWVSLLLLGLFLFVSELAKVNPEELVILASIKLFLLNIFLVGLIYFGKTEMIFRIKRLANKRV